MSSSPTLPIRIGQPVTTITPDNLPDYLLSVEQINDPQDVSMIRFETGGYANHTYLVRHSNGPALLVKQADAKQIVERGFDLPPERIAKEAAALAILKTNYPDIGAWVHDILNFDPDNRILILAYIEDAHIQTQDIAQGRIDPAVAERTIDLLRQLHIQTRGDTQIRDSLLDNENFYVCQDFQAADVNSDPEIVQSIRTFVKEAQALDQCLIHADIDPKNVLIRDSQNIYLIDFEQSCYATPAYDIGYNLAHYYLAALHDGNENKGLLLSAIELIDRLWARYFTGFPSQDLEQLQQNTLTYLCAFILGRMDGLARYQAIQSEQTRTALRESALQHLFNQESDPSAFGEDLLNRVKHV